MDEATEEKLDETKEEDPQPLEVTVIEKKVEKVNEDLDYAEFDISDSEIEEADAR